ARAITRARSDPSGFSTRHQARKKSAHVSSADSVAMVPAAKACLWNSMTIGRRADSAALRPRTDIRRRARRRARLLRVLFLRGRDAAMAASTAEGHDPPGAATNDGTGL